MAWTLFVIWLLACAHPSQTWCQASPAQKAKTTETKTGKQVGNRIHNKVKVVPDKATEAPAQPKKDNSAGVDANPNATAGGADSTVKNQKDSTDTGSKGQTKASITCSAFASETNQDVDHSEAAANKLDQIAPDITVRAIDSRNFLVCAPDKDSIVAIKTNLAALLKSQELKPVPHEIAGESHYVRLYFDRHAQDLAALLSQSYPNLKVGALGSDTVVFQSSNPIYEREIHELKRWIALVDNPRPQLALNIWSAQASSRNEQDAENMVSGIRRIVAQHNQQLQEALIRAWRFIGPMENNATEQDKARKMLFSPFLAAMF